MRYQIDLQAFSKKNFIKEILLRRSKGRLNTNGHVWASIMRSTTTPAYVHVAAAWAGMYGRLMTYVHSVHGGRPRSTTTHVWPGGWTPILWRRLDAHFVEAAGRPFCGGGWTPILWRRLDAHFVEAAGRPFCGGGWTPKCRYGSSRAWMEVHVLGWASMFIRGNPPIAYGLPLLPVAFHT